MYGKAPLAGHRLRRKLHHIESKLRLREAAKASLTFTSKGFFFVIYAIMSPSVNASNFLPCDDFTL
jgi:hypothetical protein